MTRSCRLLTLLRVYSFAGQYRETDRQKARDRKADIDSERQTDSDSPQIVESSVCLFEVMRKESKKYFKLHLGRCVTRQ